MYFRCGGIIVVFNWVYLVVDGYFGLYFLKFWVEIVCGKEVFFFFVYECYFVKLRNFNVFFNFFFGVLECLDGNGDLIYDLYIKDIGRNLGEEKKFIEGKVEEKEIFFIV